MFTIVIWATDGSEHADRALGYAAQIANEDGAALHAVHVVEKFSTGRVAGQDAYANEEEKAAKIRHQIADEPQQLRPALHIEVGNTGDAAERISELARDLGADLIVVGTRGHSPVSGALLGSVTQRLLHLAPCPVLAVPPGAAAVTDDASAARTVHSAA